MERKNIKNYNKGKYCFYGNKIVKIVGYDTSGEWDYDVINKVDYFTKPIIQTLKDETVTTIVNHNQLFELTQDEIKLAKETDEKICKKDAANKLDRKKYFKDYYQKNKKIMDNRTLEYYRANLSKKKIANQKYLDKVNPKRKRYNKDMNNTLTPTYIINQVCEYFSISENELKTKTRKREVVEKRQLCMYFIRKYCVSKTNISQPPIEWCEIARIFKNVNQATDIHAIKCVNNMMLNRKEYFEIENKLKLKMSSN